MAATPAQISDFITNSRTASRQALALKDAISKLTDDYAGLNVQAELTQQHFLGENEGITVADFNAAIQVLGQLNTDLKADADGAGPGLSKMVKLIKIS